MKKKKKMAKHILILFVICVFSITLCLTERSSKRSLNIQVQRLVGKTELLETEVDNIWNEITSSGACKTESNDELQIENNGNDYKDCLVNVDDQKMTVAEFVSIFKTAFKNEKQWQKETVANLKEMLESYQTGVNTGLGVLESSLQKLEYENQALKLSSVEMQKDLKRRVAKIQNDNENMKSENQELKQTVLVMQMELNQTQDELMCDEGWISFNYHCYLVVTSSRRWNAASEYCKARDSYLIEITSDKELAFANGLTSGYGETFFWVGATDRQVEGTFVYQHSKLGVPDKYWSTGQPDDYMTGQDCCSIGWLKGYFNFDDADCNYPHFNFVCEKS